MIEVVERRSSEDIRRLVTQGCFKPIVVSSNLKGYIQANMMKFTLLAAVAASAAAFAPSVSKSSSTALNGYENEIGTIAPTGFFGKNPISDGWVASRGSPM